MPWTASYIPMPEPSIQANVAVTTPPHPAAPGQFFDITTPIIPGQIKRYERNQLYAKYNYRVHYRFKTVTNHIDSQGHNEDFEVQKGPLDCSE
jgi:hypothetical protein